MPRVDSQQPLLPSLLDRLIDSEPDVSTEPAWSRSQGLRELKESVKRDLEALLNTRQTLSDLPADFVEAAQSILTYGLPDLTSSSIVSLEDRERLRRSVEDAIRRFEPRLMKVRVSLREAASEADRTLRLMVDAWLRLDPDPEPVTFDTVVQPATGRCEVQSTS
ncbi:MAG: type VI secretion system baseplate subunit TssE [Pirellulales bacterium]